MLNLLQLLISPPNDIPEDAPHRPAAEAAAVRPPQPLAQPAAQAAPAARCPQPAARHAAVNLRAHAAAVRAAAPVEAGRQRPAACAAAAALQRQGAAQPDVAARQQVPPRVDVARQAAAPGLMAAPVWAGAQRGVGPVLRHGVAQEAQVHQSPEVVQQAAPQIAPQVADAMVPAAGQAAEQLPGPYPVRQPDRAVIARQAADDLLRLRDLRIGDEKDHELVFAPPIPPGTFQPIVPLVDAASAGLEGRAYLEFLVKDIRTDAGISLILREDVLNKADISADRVCDIARRMRPIMAQVYANPELRIEMELLITQALTFCHDRLELAIGEMEDTALLSHLSSGRMDEIT